MVGLDELQELRVELERIRSLLESLVVRGLRACGSDELLQIGSYAEHLDRTGAGHLAANLSNLKEEIVRGDRNSAKTLLETQTCVRLLERLLTIRVVKARYTTATSRLEERNQSLNDANEGGDVIPGTNASEE